VKRQMMAGTKSDSLRRRVSFPPSTRWNWTAAVVAVVARAREAPAKTLIGARENDDDETPEAEWSRAPFGAQTAGSESGAAAADDTESGTGSAERSRNDAASTPSGGGARPKYEAA